jgi:hypothetical protein
MEILSKIYNLLHDKTPAVNRPNLTPISAGRLAELERKFGPLPREVTELLTWHDGSLSDPWLGQGYWNLLPSGAIEQFLDNSLRIGAVFTTVSGEIGLQASMSKFVPFASWNGNLFAAAVVQATDGKVEVFGLDPVNCTGVFWASSMTAFFQLIYDALASGAEELDIDSLPNQPRPSISRSQI